MQKKFNLLERIEREKYIVGIHVNFIFILSQETDINYYYRYKLLLLQGYIGGL